MHDFHFIVSIDFEIFLLFYWKHFRNKMFQKFAVDNIFV